MRPQGPKEESSGGRRLLLHQVPLYTPSAERGGSDVARRGLQRDWYHIAEQPAPAPHLARPYGCDALCIVLATVPRVRRSCEHFSDGFDLHPLERTPVNSAETLLVG